METFHQKIYFFIYALRVESDELSKIRNKLNGLKRGPNNGEMEEWRA